MSKLFKTILCADFETRWSSKPTEWSADPFTLSKLTTEEYIRSPLFHAFGLCLHEVGSAAPIQWYSHEELPRILKMYDWSTTALLCHNSQFDAAILSYIYGIKPCFILDTLSMGRALRGVEVGNSLMKLAEDYGLPPKGRAVHSTDGLFTLPVHIERELAEYCTHDVFLCEQIFMKLLYRIDPLTGESAGEFPKKELRLIDMTVRMYTDPVLELDKPMLEEALIEEKDKLASALERTGVQEASLASNDHFADVLRTMGVHPPTKISKATNKEAYAFAKNDALFQALLNGDNEDVALLCEARLKVKSTLERTRAQRFIDIAERGTLPIPLAYYGAATGRWAAAKGANLNLQNLKRGSFLRKAIMAPDGYLLAVADLSQIEPRVLAWLSGYEDMLDIFRAGGDPYATFGAQMFGIPGLTKDTHPLLRQSAKSALLGCFTGDTLVLTDAGVVPIDAVTVAMRVWDGLEFVQHQGVVAQGDKVVAHYHGVGATEDHLFMSEGVWHSWDTEDTASGKETFRRGIVRGPYKTHGLLQSLGGFGLRTKAPTYDIAMAGPRNRYTILTNEGPLIVHNCGYQLGWVSFAGQLLVGFLGAPPQRYTKADAIQLGVTARDVQKFLAWDDNLKAMQEIPHTCTEEELLIHCLAAKAIIEKYRNAASPVTDFWSLLGNLLERSLVGGEEYNHKDVLLFRKGEIIMTNGMALRYPDLKAHIDPEDKKKRVVYTYADGKKRIKLYPGKICNNVTQGTSRIVMSDGLLRIDKQYRVLGTVHDEGISLVPEPEAQAAYKWMLEQMVVVPKWMPGIPLNADGGVHKRYGLAKK